MSGKLFQRGSDVRLEFTQTSGRETGKGMTGPGSGVLFTEIEVRCDYRTCVYGVYCILNMMIRLRKICTRVMNVLLQLVSRWVERVRVGEDIPPTERELLGVEKRDMQGKGTGSRMKSKSKERRL